MADALAGRIRRGERLLRQVMIYSIIACSEGRCAMTTDPPRLIASALRSCSCWRSASALRLAARRHRRLQRQSGRAPAASRIRPDVERRGRRCAPASAPAESRRRAPHRRRPAMSAPTAAPGVAFNYRYAFRLAAPRIAEVQEQHAQMCERLTVARCRITGMLLSRRQRPRHRGDARLQARSRRSPACSAARASRRWSAPRAC